MKSKINFEYIFGGSAAFALLAAAVFSSVLFRPSITKIFKALTAASASLYAPIEPAPVSPQQNLQNSNAQQQLVYISSLLGAELDEAPHETEEKENANEPNSGELPYLVPTDKKGGDILRKTYSYTETASCFYLPSGSMIKNSTDISNDYLIEQSKKAWPSEIKADGSVEILIIHTHTTESYEPFTRDYYEKDFSSRTTELDYTVVKVGEIIAERLKSAGIGVIHDKTLHDYPKYSGAYDRSTETVIKILDKNPTIKIVLDIHRDGIEDQAGTRYAPVCQVDGKNAAQVMIIVGCENVPQYRYNLRLATAIQAKLDADYPSLARPILFAQRNYNQELSKGSLLIEVGSNANSLDEAFYTAELLGLALSEMFEK